MNDSSTAGTSIARSTTSGLVVASWSKSAHLTIWILTLCTTGVFATANTSSVRVSIAAIEEFDVQDGGPGIMLTCRVVDRWSILVASGPPRWQGEPMTKLQPKATTPVRRIDHVAVLVRDGDSALRRFQDEFGLVLVGDSFDPAGLFRLIYLDSGDTTLQLVQPLLPGPLMAHLDERGPGLHHVCFLVDDVDAAIARASGGPEGSPYVGGRGAKVCFLADRSHGVIIELTESATET